MKNLILLSFLLIPMFGWTQRHRYGFKSKEMLPLGYHERFVKDTVCADCVSKNGVDIPTVYMWVEYIINDPPDDFEMAKWYWTEFPKTYNGWKVEHVEGWYLYGYTEGTKFSIVNVTCDTCGYLNKYSHDIVLDYGHDDDMSLTIKQNKDTTDKYFYLKYPELKPKKSNEQVNIGNIIIGSHLINKPRKKVVRRH